MSDLFGNHIVGFPTRRLNYSDERNVHEVLVFCLWGLSTKDGARITDHPNMTSAVARGHKAPIQTSKQNKTWYSVIAFGAGAPAVSKCQSGNYFSKMVSCVFEVH